MPPGISRTSPAVQRRAPGADPRETTPSGRSTSHDPTACRGPVSRCRRVRSTAGRAGGRAAAGARTVHRSRAGRSAAARRESAGPPRTASTRGRRLRRRCRRARLALLAVAHRCDAGARPPRCGRRADVGSRRHLVRRSAAGPVLRRLLQRQGARPLPGVARSDAALRGLRAGAAAGAGAARRPGVPGADRVRLLADRGQPGAGGGDVAVHGGDRQGLRPARRSLGGRAPRPDQGDRRRGAPPARPDRPLRLALPRRGRLQRRRGPRRPRAGADRRAAAGRRRRGDRPGQRRHVLRAGRHVAAAPGNQGLRPEAHRRRAGGEGARALRLRRARRRRPVPARQRGGAGRHRPRPDRRARRHLARGDPRAQSPHPPRHHAAGHPVRRAPPGRDRRAGERRLRQGPGDRAARGDDPRGAARRDRLGDREALRHLDGDADGGEPGRPGALAQVGHHALRPGERQQAARVAAARARTRRRDQSHPHRPQWRDALRHRGALQRHAGVDQGGQSPARERRDPRRPEAQD